MHIFDALRRFLIEFLPLWYQNRELYLHWEEPPSDSVMICFSAVIFCLVFSLQMHLLSNMTVRFGDPSRFKLFSRYTVTGDCRFCLKQVPNISYAKPSVAKSGLHEKIINLACCDYAADCNYFWEVEAHWNTADTVGVERTVHQLCIVMSEVCMNPNWILDKLLLKLRQILKSCLDYSVERKDKLPRFVGGKNAKKHQESMIAVIRIWECPARRFR